MFVDRVEITVEAGKGGDGCSSFRRERFVPKGGPDGGDGGDGGSIILLARRGVDSLAGVASRKLWKAQPGMHGQGSNRHGRKGRDLTLCVPPGTVVIDHPAGYVLKDLATEGDQVVAARGGKGGRGNASFKSATHRAPREWTRGEEGEKRHLILELKMIADVGLVGMPNAGKSTLLSRLSRARPQIAPYPFTTKTPHLGLIRLDTDHALVMADIPGLIEGAHQGAGLGHDFLKHIERTRVLVHLVEPFPLDQSDPVHNYQTICRELARYDSALAMRPQVVVVTKADLPGAELVRDRIADEIGQPVLLISAVTGKNLNQLVRAAADQLQKVKAEVGA